MLTAKEREVAFRKDLQELLDKHGALLTATYAGEPYNIEHAGVCIIEMDSVWNSTTRDCEKEFTEFLL